jgi:hypothetical protein
MSTFIEYALLVLMAMAVATFVFVISPTEGRCQFIPFPGQGQDGGFQCSTTVIHNPPAMPKVCTVCTGPAGTTVTCH